MEEKDGFGAAFETLYTFREAHGDDAPLPKAISDLFEPGVAEQIDAQIKEARRSLAESQPPVAEPLEPDDTDLDAVPEDFLTSLEGRRYQRSQRLLTGSALALIALLVAGTFWLSRNGNSGDQAPEYTNSTATYRPVEEPTPSASSAKASASGSGLSDADVDRLTTYAVYLGRGIACGVPTARSRYDQVFDWLRRRAGSASEVDAMSMVLIAGIADNQKRQSGGGSPDSCETVLREFDRIEWP